MNSKGSIGIIEGRGSNKNMPLQEISKSDIIIFWGKNPKNNDMLELTKDKKIIVIDPLKTKIAEIADIHVQLKPKTDIFFAMLLSRFSYIWDICDEEYLNKYASEYQDYYELTQSIRIVPILEKINATLDDINDILELVKEKKVAIVCGKKIQEYYDGDDIMRAIDAFAVMLGLFGKNGSGVYYIGESNDIPYKNGFDTDNGEFIFLDEFDSEIEEN